jgi:hypothetical protein
VQLPPSSRSGASWIANEFGDAIKSQQNFELQLMVTPAPQQAAAGSPLPSATLQAQFRCAANTGLDNNMLPIGIPNFLPNEDGSNEARSFYFATLRDISRASSLAQDPAGSGSAAAGGGSGTGNKQRREGGGSTSRGVHFNLMAANQEAMPDIKLGPLLGKGAFGRVYRGKGLGGRHGRK